jgi:hypothetical protein
MHPSRLIRVAGGTNLPDESVGKPWAHKWLELGWPLKFWERREGTGRISIQLFLRISRSSAMSYKKKSKQMFYRVLLHWKPDNTNTENIEREDGNPIRELLDVCKSASLSLTLPWLILSLASEWESSPLPKRSFDYVLFKYSKLCT